MPKLGLTMTEGTLIEWLVKPGDRFVAGQGLFIVESEKAAVEVPADQAGRLLEASAVTANAVPVGAVIGYWDDDKEGAAETAPPAPAPAAVQRAEPDGAGHSPPLPATSSIPEERVIATPLARRLAEQRGIELKEVHGSGPRGRIRARDLDGIAAAGAAATADATPQPAGVLRPFTAAQQTIARRLVQAKRDIPHFYLSVEAEVSRLLTLREELRAALPGRRHTLNHFLLAAVGRALVDEPLANAIWTEAGILQLSSSDIGMAVHTERGLVAPVLRDVGRLSLALIGERADHAIELAQQGRLAPADMAGGAITVSNAGMHDVTYMTSIIPPAQSMILGVGSVRELFRPDEAGRPLLRREIGLVLSADHRVLDGVRALKFLQRVVAYLEHPLKLAVQ